MKVFLDNCLPRTLKPYLSADHHIEHARDRKWGELSNGELLRRVEEEFDVFISRCHPIRRSSLHWRIPITERLKMMAELLFRDEKGGSRQPSSKFVVYDR